MARIFTAAFLGKVAAALFIAVCIALGFGPTEWAAMILGTDPTLLARAGFLFLALLAAVGLLWPFIHARFFTRVTAQAAGATVGTAVPQSPPSPAPSMRDWPIRELFAFIRPDLPLTSVQKVGPTVTIDNLDGRWKPIGACEFLRFYRENDLSI
jgi:hypothetical protein